MFCHQVTYIVRNILLLLSTYMYVQCVHRSESPSQVFLIVLKWLMNTLKTKPPEEWKDLILCYDNMCHLDGLRAAKVPLRTFACSLQSNVEYHKEDHR